MLDQILLTKVAYDTDIPEWLLRNTPKFWNYWLDYLMSDDSKFTLDSVIEYTLELAFNGEFGEGVWND